MDAALRDFFLLFSILAIIPLGVVTVIGLVISVLQAATQIQEQSLSFGFKMIGFLLVTIAGAPFALETLRAFLERMYLASAVAGA